MGASVNAPDPDMCTVTQAVFAPTPTQTYSICYQAGGKANTPIESLEVGLTTTVLAVCGLLAALTLKTHRRRRQNHTPPEA